MTFNFIIAALDRVYSTCGTGGSPEDFNFKSLQDFFSGPLTLVTGSLGVVGNLISLAVLCHK